MRRSRSVSCGEDSSGSILTCILPTPCSPGVAPPMERISRTARFIRVTRRSRRSNRYTPRTSRWVAAPSAVPWTTPARRILAKLALNSSSTLCTSHTATESSASKPPITVASCFQVAPLATGLVGNSRSIRHELPATSIKSSCSRVSGPSGEYKVGPCRAGFDDDQASIVGQLWYAARWCRPSMCPRQRCNSGWRAAAGFGNASPAPTFSRRSSYCNFAETLIGSFCSAPFFTAAPLSSVAARTKIVAAGVQLDGHPRECVGFNPRRQIDRIRSANPHGPIPANRLATTMVNRAIRIALNIADTSLAISGQDAAKGPNDA